MTGRVKQRRHRSRTGEFEDLRRHFLVKALGLGLFAASGAVGCARWDRLTGGRRIRPGQSIHRVRGDVRVDGMPADRGSDVPADAVIETGSDSQLIFVVGQDAFIMRENSLLELEPVDSGAGAADEADAGSPRMIADLRLITGKLLSVFGARDDAEPPDLRTPTATIGIRGTGIYLESESDRTYVCTCYGHTVLRAVGDPQSREEITSSQHDEPRYILGDGRAGERIEPAPVINHTDMELLLIEELVGRRPPFSVSGGGYGGAAPSNY